MQDFDPWNGWRNAAGNITSALMQSPMIKAQAAETQMRTQLYNQQAQLHAQERAAMERKGRLVTALEQNGAQAVFDAQGGVSDSPAIRSVIGATSALSGEHPGVVTEQFGKWLQMSKGVKDKDPTAVFTGSTGKGLPKGQAINEAQRQQLIQEDQVKNQGLNATREKVARIGATRPMVVPDNSMMVDPTTGQTMNYGMQRVGLGDTLFNGDVGMSLGQVAKGGEKLTGFRAGDAIYNGTNLVERVPSPSTVSPILKAKVESILVQMKAISDGTSGLNSTNRVVEMKRLKDELDQLDQNNRSPVTPPATIPGISAPHNPWPSEQEVPDYFPNQTNSVSRAQAAPVQKSAQSGDLPVFADEASARAAGYGPGSPKGDKVRLQNIGNQRVRLY